MTSLAYPTTMGRLFANITLAVGAVGVLIPPSQNTRGVLVSSLNLLMAPGTNFKIYMSADQPTTPPPDFTKAIVFTGGNPTTGNDYLTFPYPFLMDPGLGLWASCEFTSGSIAVTYDLVQPA